MVVPSDQQFEQRRAEQASQEDGARGIPEAAVMEMKASMSIPNDGLECFEEIVFAELKREDAEKVVSEYNKDAKGKGYGNKFEREKLSQRQQSARSTREGFRMNEFGIGGGFGVCGFNNGSGWGFEMGRGGFGMRGGFRSGFGISSSNGFAISRGGGYGMGFGCGIPYRNNSFNFHSITATA